MSYLVQVWLFTMIVCKLKKSHFPHEYIYFPKFAGLLKSSVPCPDSPTSSKSQQHEQKAN